MKMLFPSLCMMLSFVATDLSAASPFPAPKEEGAAVYETAKEIGLYNSRTGILFDRKNFLLQGLWLTGGENLVKSSSLWKVELMTASERGKTTLLQPADASGITVRSSNENGNAALTVLFSQVKKDRFTADVTLRVLLEKDSPMVRWHIAVKVTGGDGSLWNVTFPMIAASCMTTDPLDTMMVYPYRRGRLTPLAGDGQNLQPYPGPAVKFQFMSVYNRRNSDGVYIGVEDPDGYSKGFYQRGLPKSLRVYMGIEHYPENRGTDLKTFDSPYYVTVCGFKGDWWDAARIYRNWWVKQEWASKGPMIFRKDVPEWLKNAAMSIKLSTCPPRNVATNLTNALEIGKIIGNRPILGIWYHFENKKDTMDGFGFPLPPQPGVEDALRQMSQSNIHVLAYVQSLIYDQKQDEKDVPAASRYYAKDISGKPYNYEVKMSMCRCSDWWHRRVLVMSENALRMGFEGIYLDSFGKSSPECFDAGHGHPLGGGSYGIQGQRRMAGLVRELIKKESANNTMAGEAPVEAFADKLDYYLFAVNTMPGYIPLWRTVLGDYMIGHGRGMAQSKAKDNIAAECAQLFVDGTILGRISVYGRSLLQGEENAELRRFILSLVDYTDAGRDYLRLGEFLHPAALSPEPPPLKFHEYIKNSEMVAPAVFNSVTRSHRDGSVAYTFVNVGDTAYRGAFNADPAKCVPERKHGEVFRMDSKGVLTSAAKISGPAMINFELKPLETVIFIVK